MANIEGRCPKCGETLSVPERLSQFSCMFCGALLKPEQLIAPEEQEDLSKAELMAEKLPVDPNEGGEEVDDLIMDILEVDPYNLKANGCFLKRTFKSLVFQYPDAMEHFNRAEYEPYFNHYKLRNTVIIEAADRYHIGAKDPKDTFLHELCKELYLEMDAKITGDASLRSRRAKEEKLDQYRMTVLLYTIPMIRELDLGCKELLSDILVEEWRALHPKLAMNKATFEQLNIGFKKGKLCFITTAVCDSFGKPDDCYELTRFRGFRDTYMMRSEEGARLVEEYYDKAPGIVMCIDHSADPEGIYRSIWEQYLKPCLSQIEAGEEEACFRRYAQMVRELERRYLS